MPRNQTHELAVENLYNALLRLMDQKPYREISVTELASEAGVSRMAFYRNYQDKGEILIDHVERTLRCYYQKCQEIENLTEREMWVSFFLEMKNDIVVNYLRKAELMDTFIELQKRYAEKLYRTVLLWNMDLPLNKMLLYQRMGNMMGLLLYIADYPTEADEQTLADQILLMATTDSNRQQKIKTQAKG